MDHRTRRRLVRAQQNISGWIQRNLTVIGARIGGVTCVPDDTNSERPSTTFKVQANGRTAEQLFSYEDIVNSWETPTRDTAAKVQDLITRTFPYFFACSDCLYVGGILDPSDARCHNEPCGSTNGTVKTAQDVEEDVKAGKASALRFPEFDPNRADMRLPEDRPPATLYKFRTYPSLGALSGWRRDAAKEYRSHVHAMLQAGTFYLPARAQLNDSFELASILQSVPRDVMRSYVISTTAALLESGRLKPETRAAIMDPQQLDFIVNHHQRTNLRTVISTFIDEATIFCMAGNQTSTLLWSHYAEGQRGIALHLDATKLPLSKMAEKVIYSNDLPVIELPRHDNSATFNRIVRLATCYKHTDWAYEDEFRLVIPKNPDNPTQVRNLRVNVKDQSLSFEPTIITGVTLGPAMPVDAKRELLEFITIHRPDLKIYQAKRGDKSYKVEIGLGVPAAAIRL